jgi:carbon-monoxide dehydrogenase medium subunit
MYEPEWKFPTSLAEALAIFAAVGGDAVAVAGGTDIAPVVSGGARRPRVLVDLGRVEDMRLLSADPGEAGGGGVEIGALVTHGVLASDERVSRVAGVLSAACRTVGAPQVRARGTIGGNLANASPAADGVVALVALGASAVVESDHDGRRDVPLSEFLLGPGRTVLRPDELVTGVTFISPSSDARGVYRKAGQRKALAIAIASVALVHEPGAGTVRIALGSVAPTPIRATEAEGLFKSGWENEPARAELLNEVALAAARAASPIDDVRASAWYRTVLVEVLTRRALEEACLQIENTR